MEKVKMYIFSKLTASKQTNEVFEYAKAHNLEIVELERVFTYSKKDYVEAAARGRVIHNDYAIIYARFSSNNQNEISITGQLDACFAHCEKYNIKVKCIYVDMAQTAKFDNRVAFQKLNADVLEEYHNGCRMLVYANNRFARNRADSVLYRGFYDRFGIVFDSVTEICPRGQDGVFITSIREVMDQYYSENLAQNVTRGLLQRAKMCQYTGGMVTYGYKVNPQTKLYEICESEAENVRLIFKMYVAKQGYAEILKELDARGAVCRSGKPFSKNVIGDMVTNEKYAGVYTYNKRAGCNSVGERNSHAYKPKEDTIRIPGGVPAIVDQHTFDQAQKRKEANVKGTRSRREKDFYLLTGLIECGECGHAFTSNRKFAGRNKTKYLTYRCTNHNKGGTCHCKEVNRDYLEAFVLDVILSKIITDSRRDELVEEFRKQQGSAIKEHAEKKIRLKQEIAAIESKNEGILGIIESGKALPILIERLERNLQDIERIKADLDVLIAHPPKEIDAKKFAELVERTRRAISAKNYHELKRFVSLYVSKIIVRNDDITVVVSYAKIVLLVGGAEGNRTPVQRQLDKTFSERSLLITFPHPGGNKHPTGFSSFMMHGMGKAYHTHGLHSDHTRARLVDLPGRMGA